MSSAEKERTERDLVSKRLEAIGVPPKDYSSLSGTERERVATEIIALLNLTTVPLVRAELVKAASEVRVPPRPLLGILRGLLPDLESHLQDDIPESEDDFVDFLLEMEPGMNASDLGWEIASTIADLSGDSDYDEISAVLLDRRFGRTRQMLPYALARMKSRRKETVSTLISLLGDRDVTGHAIGALNSLGATEAIPAIRPYLYSKKQLERTEAKKALLRLEKPDSLGLSRADRRGVSLDDSLFEHNYSVRVDLEQVVPMLIAIAALLPKSRSLDLDALEARLFRMELEEEEDFDVEVLWEGQKTLLRISIFMNDIDTLTVTFLGGEAPISLVENAVEIWEANT